MCSNFLASLKICSASSLTGTIIRATGAEQPERISKISKS